MGEYGVTEADFGQIAADALDDEVLADTPRHPPGAKSAPCLSPAQASEKLVACPMGKAR